MLFATGFAANLGVLGTFAGPDVLVVLRRAQPRVAHRRTTSLRRTARGVPPRRRRPRRRTAARDATRRAPSSSPRRSSRWTVTSRRSTSWPRCAHTTGQCSCSTRPTRCSAPRSTSTASTSCASAPCRRPSVRSAGSSPGRGGSPTCSSTGPAPTSSRPRRPPPTPPPPSPRSRVLQSPEGDTLRAQLHANVERLRPGHPSPIIPYVCGSEARALEAAAALYDDGLLVTAIRPPTVPPGTARLRVALSATHTPEQVDVLAASLHRLFPERPMTRPRTLVFVAGTGTDIGKTWWTAATARELRAAGVAVAARKPVQSGEPGAPTDADVLGRGHRRGPRHRLFPAPHLSPRVGPADGGPRARRALVQHRRPRGRDRVARRRRRRSGRRGRRPALTDQ